jgi:hypothetical protein
LHNYSRGAGAEYFREVWELLVGWAAECEGDGGGDAEAWGGAGEAAVGGSGWLRRIEVSGIAIGGYEWGTWRLPEALLCNLKKASFEGMKLKAPYVECLELLQRTVNAVI